MSTIQAIQAEEEMSFEDFSSTVELPTDLRRIVLTGFMGAGKSTVGRLIAARLGWKFMDLDEHLEVRAGLPVPEIFALYGENHFRRLESSALASALAGTNTVLALGGGAPEVLTNRLLLEQTPGTVIIFLDAPFPALFDRCVLQSVSRPLLADPAAAQVRFAQRHPLYRRLARHTIETSSIDSEQAAFEVFAAVAKQGTSTMKATRKKTPAS